MAEQKIAGTRRGIYFFLSYAHSVATVERIGSDADPSVGRFFEDLRRRVAEHAEPREGMRIAFFDQEIPADSDLKSELSQALGLAEVFIPLYSPGYFAKSWPMREQEVFLGRLGGRPDVDPAAHVVPVLWTPFPSWEAKPAGVNEALKLGADIQGYAENGLRALCMLATYRSSYEAVLDRVAGKVVSVVERSPIGPSTAPDLDDVPGRTFAEAAFAVAVLTPRNGPGSLLRLGDARDRDRPFADRRAPAVAQYVASAAERLGFQTRILDPRQSAELARSPAIVVVDPWVVTENEGAARLEETFKQVPDWVLPLVMMDGDDPLYAGSGPELKARTMAVLRNLGRSAVDYIQNMEDFRRAVPRVVSKARRVHLRNAEVYPPSGAARFGPGPVDGGASDSPREGRIGE